MYSVLGGNDAGDPARLPDLADVHRWFGVKFALLEAPDCRIWGIGYHSDTTVANYVGVTRDVGIEKPIYVRVAHELGDGTPIDIVTQRTDFGSDSALHHAWSTLVNYQYQLIGSRGNVPWGSGPPPTEISDLLDLNNPPEPTGACAVLIDGVEAIWDKIILPDIATGLSLMACGGTVGTSLVAVSGPEHALGDAAIRMWPSDEAASSSGDGSGDPRS